MQAKTGAKSQHKIFLVEDDDFLSSMLLKKFREHAIPTERFETGRSVLEAFAKEVPSLLLLDLYLPDINGFEVLEAVRKDETLKHLTVLVISNTAQAKDKERVEAMGARFITKALVTPEEIAKHVEDALGALVA